MDETPIIKNGFLFVVFLSTGFIIACVVNDSLEYINYGFVTFLYSYLAYFVNILFQKSKIFPNKDRNVEFWTQIVLLLLWVVIIFNFYVS